jgi:hypothetical protein
MRDQRSFDQLTLFRPQLTSQHWTSFPAEVREQTLKLLARFLTHHRGARLAAQEVRDE